MANRPKSNPFTPQEVRARQAIEFGIIALAAARGILMMAQEVLPPTAPAQIERMKAKKIPYSLAASLQEDLLQVIGFNLEEAIAELESALEDSDAVLRKRWRRDRG